MTKSLMTKAISSISIFTLVVSSFVPVLVNAQIELDVINDCPSFQTVTVVSDETTLADGSASVETYVHGNWDSISGAEWIWKTAQVQNPAADETVVFTKTFPVPGTSITFAEIEIAADNEFVLEVNGTEVANESDEDNFSSTQTYNILANIDAGETNDIEVTVKNRALADSDHTTNPAGLLYKITIDGVDCGNGDEGDGDGSIVVCKIIQDTDGDVIAGTLGTTFTVPFLTDADYEGPETGDPADVVFDTPLALETVFGNVQGECYEVEDLDFGRYYYGQETISPGATWDTVLYNDQINMTVDSLDDLEPFNTNADPSNDNWDGVINLSEQNPSRTLIVLNRLLDACPNLEGIQADGADCDPNTDTATIYATKIVCSAEEYLPNWGDHDPVTSITSTTADEFLADVNENLDSPVCWEEEWHFQWAPSDVEGYNPGDNTTGTPAGWTSFVGNSVDITLPVTNSYVWVRENIDTDYIPFSEDTEAPYDDVSAELYCNIDVLNYDNFDRVDNLVAGKDYYCVGFNVLKEHPPVVNACSANEAGTELISNGSFETPVVTNTALWDIVDSGINGVVWLASWINPTGAPATAKLELQENGLFSGVAAVGTQWIELDSDWDGPSGSNSGEAGAVEISQNVVTEAGVDYTVSLDFSARPNTGSNENGMTVWADGVLIGTIPATAGTGSLSWTPYSFNFTATDASTTIALRDAGANNNSVGTLVDDVSVKCILDEVPNPHTGTLRIIKVIANNTDENVTADDFGFTVNGGTQIPFESDGQNDMTVAVGEYDVVETGTVANYTVSYNNCTDVSVADGETETCTITNTFSLTPQDVPECSDGVDNDDEEDAHVDYPNDPGCSSPEDPDESDNGGPQSFSSSSSGSTITSSGSPVGRVLGAEDICNFSIDTYMRRGYANNTAQVQVMQALLNKYVGSNLAVDGLFGPMTEAAVKAFQIKYADFILKPWNLTQPTGIFFRTTLVQAKNLECPAEILPIPTNLIPWSQSTGAVPPPAN